MQLSKGLWINFRFQYSLQAFLEKNQIFFTTSSEQIIYSYATDVKTLTFFS